jgi:CRP/FNR family transcriptional regulator, cyclic AMP receptor protein
MLVIYKEIKMPAEEGLLEEVPFFKLLDREERAALAAVLDEATIKSGETLFRLGDPGDSLYLVRSGKVELWVKDNVGEKITLAIADRGDFFGELSLLDGGPRAATALAIEDTELLVLDRDDLLLFLRKKPDAALDILTVMGQRIRHSDALVRGRVSRNANEEEHDGRTMVEKAADWIAVFSGSLPFLGLHIIWFVIWIGMNTLPGFFVFDPFPFGLLTMTVSLEAIILSVFVLLSQSRQVAKDKVRSDIEYEVNLKAELEIAHMHEKVDALHAEMLNRLHTIEKLISRNSG